ncbi:MAG: hypothetical protein INQ03_22040 [Candidatus Heimdallarchaeota archaeon]|nr:hypothetical protein [Candidatus Heimdallarchaeota archaeon]
MQKVILTSVLNTGTKIKILHSLYHHEDGLSITSLSVTIHEKISDVRTALHDLSQNLLIKEIGRKYMINHSYAYSKPITNFFKQWEKL